MKERLGYAVSCVRGLNTFQRRKSCLVRQDRIDSCLENGGFILRFYTESSRTRTFERQTMKGLRQWKNSKPTARLSNSRTNENLKIITKLFQETVDSMSER